MGGESDHLTGQRPNDALVASGVDEYDLRVGPVAEDYSVKRSGASDFRRSDKMSWDDFLETNVKGSKAARNEYERAAREGFAGTGDDVARAEASGASMGAPRTVEDALAQELAPHVNEPYLEELAMREERSKVGSPQAEGRAATVGTASDYLDAHGDEATTMQEGDEDEFPEDPFLDSGGDNPRQEDPFLEAAEKRRQASESDGWVPAGAGGGSEEDAIPGSAPGMSIMSMDDLDAPQPRPAADKWGGGGGRTLALSDLLPQGPGDDPVSVELPRDESLREVRDAMARMMEQNRLLAAQLEASERRSNANEKKFGELMDFVGKVLSGNENQRPIVVKVEMPQGASVAPIATVEGLAPNRPASVSVTTDDAEDLSRGGGASESTTRSGVRPKTGNHYVSPISVGVIPKAGLPSVEPETPATGDIGTSSEDANLLDAHAKTSQKAFKPPKVPKPPRTSPWPKVLAGWSKLPTWAKVAAVAFLAGALFLCGIWMGQSPRDPRAMGEYDLVQRAVAQKFYFVRGEMKELDRMSAEPDRIRAEMLAAVKKGEGEGSERLRALQARLQDADREAERAKEAKIVLMRMTGIRDGGHNPEGGPS